MVKGSSLAGKERGGDTNIASTEPLTFATPAPAAPVAPHAPRVSVVIPAYNCADTLPACLHAIFAQTYPRGQFEVIVVDDGSSDETAAIARDAGAKGRLSLTVISQANAGPAAARNAGIRAARGAIIAFTDADCLAAPNWLESLACVFEQHPTVAGVGGPIQSAAQANTLIARYMLAADFYRQRARGHAVEYLLTANAAFRRSVLMEVGGFTERRRAWAEDADLSFRLAQSGHALLLAPDGAVTHIGVLETLREFRIGLYRYGFGNAVLARDWPMWRKPGPQLIRHLGAVVLSPLLALRLRRRTGWRQACAFWPLIVIEHIAYSAGLIAGAFANFWWRIARKEQAR